MNTLLEKQLKVLYPHRYKDVNFIGNFKDEGDRPDLEIAPCRRLLNGVMKIDNLKRIVIALDDSTTDNTEEILKEFQKKFKGEFAIVKIKWKFDYSYAKNVCLEVLDEMGIRDGEWIMCRGGDWSLPDKFIKQYNEFTKNPNNVIGRVFVPEYNPIEIINRIPVGIKNLFPFVYEVYRDRIVDWRYRKDIRWRSRAHENMYQDFYSLTHMGNYWVKHHGIPLIGTNFHHGKHEDTHEIATFKIFLYVLLTQCDYIEGIYGFTGDVDERNRKVMKEINDLGLEWEDWVPVMVDKYTKNCPTGIYDYHKRLVKSKDVIIAYG